MPVTRARDARRAARRAGRRSAAGRADLRVRRDRPLPGRARRRRLVGRAGRGGRLAAVRAGGRAAYEQARNRRARTCTRRERAARPPQAPTARRLIPITPESAGWSYVGFEALRLEPGAACARDRRRETCVVVSGAAAHPSGAANGRLGGRATPFDGPPDAAYLPPGSAFDRRAATPRSACAGPRAARAAPRRGRSPAAEIAPEIRGSGAMTRTIHNILMEDARAELAARDRGLTPAGHWSSYPPHKHDARRAPEETPARGDLLPPRRPGARASSSSASTPPTARSTRRSPSATATACSSRAATTRVGVPPGYDSYYLNVMAGPRRAWQFHNDPDHEWLMA